MKKLCLLLALCLLFALCGCEKAPVGTTVPEDCTTHQDRDDNGSCDICQVSVIVTFDIYNINDLHGKLVDGENHPGVDELSTYFKNAYETKDNVILLSSGDMWQGSSESNQTKGLFTTDWMNELGFAGMVLGNHEFDWGEGPIEENAEFAEFPLLAINVYDKDTQKQVEYCQSSVVVDADGVQIGIIGAVGDCYSSISPDKVQDLYFVTGSQLTELVKAESRKLRAEGVDFIIYALHDGWGSSRGGQVTPVTGGQIGGYYDISLSDGFVDLVFEGHTHQNYLLLDNYGVFHLQNGGDNKQGISHATVMINTANGNTDVDAARLVNHNQYTKLEDDPIIEDLLEKYETQIGNVHGTLGYNAYERDRNYLRQLAADLYYDAAIKAWGDEYQIALAGGFFSLRSPGYLPQGNVTYAQLQSILPFDNELTLCSISGRDLQRKFFQTSNDNYFISYGDYGAQLRNNIDYNATYYIVTDTYTAYYAPNNLTVVEMFGQAVYARDLLADYIAAGGLN